MIVPPKPAAGAGFASGEPGNYRPAYPDLLLTGRPPIRRQVSRGSTDRFVMLFGAGIAAERGERQEQ
jgi:hypothetical protein